MSRITEQLPGLAAAGRLYPSVILHGADMERRLDLAYELGRALLCEQAAERRPCGACRHCRRIDRKADDLFHPDFVMIARDPKKRETVVPVEKIRTLLMTAQVSPFEARGQVFVIAEAEALSPAGANTMLKTLEEPADRAPRNFLLLSPSANELLPTVRSRSLAVYLGTAAEPAAGGHDELVGDLVELWRQRPADQAFGLWLAALTERLLAAGGFDDIRARRGWTRIAAAVAEAAAALEDRGDRAAALALAADLLDAHRLRLRSIQPRRIIAGLAAHRLRRDRPETGFGSAVDTLIGPP